MYILKKLFDFDSNEITFIALIAIVSSFVLSFTEWGTTEFNASIGLRNFIATALIFSLCFVLKLAVQRYAAHKLGTDFEIKPWYLGTILSLLLVLFSNGKFIFLALGSLVFFVNEKLSLGKEGNALSPSLIGWVAMLGSIVSVLFAVIFNLAGLQSAADINLWIALYGLLPIPLIEISKYFKNIAPSDGLKMLFASPIQYFGVAILLCISALTIIFSRVGMITTINASLISLLALLLIWIIYHLFYKMNIKKESGKAFKYNIS